MLLLANQLMDNSVLMILKPRERWQPEIPVTKAWVLFHKQVLTTT